MNNPAQPHEAVQIMMAQLRCLFGDLSPEIERRLERAGPRQRAAWAESLLQANHLGEVFNDSGLSLTRECHGRATGLDARIGRISDHRFRSRIRHCLCIDPDLATWLSLKPPTIEEPRSLNSLAQFYAAFRRAYGESGNQFDRWKGAFNFAFEIQVLKGSAVIPYVLNVVNFRSGVEFRYYKLIDPTDTHFDRFVVHRPLVEEFSEKQMTAVSAYLCGFAQGYWETSMLPGDEREFLKWVESNLILFGYKAGDYFEECFQDMEAFEVEKAKRLGLLESPLRRLEA